MEEEYKPDSDPQNESRDTRGGDFTDEPRPYRVTRGVQTVLSIAVVMATLLTLWNPRKLVKQPDLTELLNLQTGSVAEQPQEADDRANHIAILAGHWQHDSGEVCTDGLVEAEVNQEIANRVVSTLEEMGYATDQFPEYDLDLLQYQGSALVALYSGSCAENPPPKSGFKIATSLTAQNPEAVNQLAVCLAENYQDHTLLPFSYEIINPDHPSYHIFSDIDPETPAVLIEMGSLKTDRAVILGSTSAVVEGITAGIQCFLEQTGGDGS